MNALFESIKAFIEKVNLVICLLAIAVAILVYQLVTKETLWALFAFCISYVVFAGIHSWYVGYKEELNQIDENRKLQEAEMSRRQMEEDRIKQEKSQTDARLRTIYASLPDEVKEGLELLYNLPQPDGGFRNSRILRIENSEMYQVIYNAFTQIRFNLGLENLMDSHGSIQSQIITIMPEFYDIIEEKANKK